MRLHCLLKTFDWFNLTGQIGCKSIEVMTTKFDQAGIQRNLSEFTPNLTSNLCPVEFNRSNLDVNPLRLHCLLKTFDQSNLTSQIGCKSIEVMTTKFDQAGIQCNLSEFPPNLTNN